jgi:alpha-tubulin suppressor-like RCC1 family protein
MRRATASALATAASLALAATLAACSQSIDVLGPAGAAGSRMPAMPAPRGDGGLIPDPDDEGPLDAGPVTPPDPARACDECAVAQLCAVDRCVDAASVSWLGMSLMHVCRIAEGQLFCWGNGQDGQLGIASRLDRDTPQRVGSFNDWLQVSPGERATCAVRAPGIVYCWGDNSSGQLGLGDTEPRTEPSALPLSTWVREVACGGNSCCAIDQDAQLWCWGDNLEGKSGQGDRSGASDVTSPVRVQAAEGARFAEIAVGQGHVCAIDEDGALWCWGRNTNVQLGIGPEPGQTRAPVRVGSASDWIAIAANQHHSCGVRADGSLWCWGESAFFETAAPDNTIDYPEPRQVGSDMDWTDVTTGWFHSCGLKRDARLFCWGRGIEGQIGREMPIASQRRDLEGYPVPEPGPVVTPAAWQRAVAGNFQTCGLDESGTAFCWGDNDSGQLGVGDQMLRQLPEPVL